MKVEVRTNAPQAKEWLSDVARSQLPFATAKALTLSAVEVRNHVRKQMPRRFTTRSKWLEKGIQSTKALKTDWPFPKASVIAGWHPRLNRTDDFLRLHELGGTKRPRKGTNLAIPTRAIRRSKTGKITKAQRPRAQLRKRGVYATDRAIKRKGTKRNRLETLYLLRRTARITPRFGYAAMVRAEFGRVYGRVFTRTMEGAIRSARPRRKA